jgi:hypothetical protein
MIFAKIDVSFPRHYRVLDVRPESVGLVRSDTARTHTAASDWTPLDDHARIARAAALGVWTAVLCYTREHMLDGFCPLSAIRYIATDEILDELVEQGLFARAEREGRTGVVILNYAKHNETKADVARRLSTDRARKKSGRIPAHSGQRVRPESRRTPPGAVDHAARPRPEPEPEGPERKELPSPAATSADSERQPPAPGDHQALIAHFVSEFERLKGAKPVIGAKGGAGAKKLLEGRSLEEAKAIVDRALGDPWWLEKSPDLAAIAGKINAFLGRREPVATSGNTLLQPTSNSWKRAEVQS